MRILKDALIILYVIIAIISTILLLSFNKYKVSVFGDYSIVIVDNNELEPNFSKGDMAIVKSSDTYRVGENVFFYNIVERKVEVTLANISRVEEVIDGTSAYEIPGGTLVSHDEVIGSISDVKVFHKIGSFVRFIESKYGYLILIVIPSGAAFLYEVYNLIVTRKEEIEEEREEQERKKRLAKKRAKERLLAKRQEENGFEDVDKTTVDEIFEEDSEEGLFEEKPKKEVTINSRETLKASLEQNKRAYEERIQKLKNNYGNKVEKHPEIEDDEDLKVTNQSDRTEKVNDMKEKANDDASNAVRKPSRAGSSSVRRKIPSHGSLASARANAANKANNIKKEESPIKTSGSRIAAKMNSTAVQEKKEDVGPVKNISSHRRVGSAVAKRAAAARAANEEKKVVTNTETSSKSTIARKPIARRSTRIQPKKNLNSGKVDGKN